MGLGRGSALLIALVFVVASLGVINTLTMNVLEQTREIGLLRAVAMTPTPVAAHDPVPGARDGVGEPRSRPDGGIGCAVPAEPGHSSGGGMPVEFDVSPVVLLSTILAALVISLCAAYFPARRAARLDIVQALHYE